MADKWIEAFTILSFPMMTLFDDFDTNISYVFHFIHSSVTNVEYMPNIA